MKKIKLFRLIVAFFLLPAAFALADDHGDSCGEATEISCGASGIGGSIDKKKDKDYFRFTLTERSFVTIYTQGGTDTYGLLTTGDCGSDIATDDDEFGDGINFKIEETLDPGDYTIVVRHKKANKTGAYQLTLQCEIDQTELCANLTPQAITCDGGVTNLSGSFQQDNDWDYYKIEIPGPNPNMIAIASTGSATVNGYLLSDAIGCANPNDNYAHDTNHSAADGHNFQINETQLDAGTYYIAVQRDGGAAPPVDYQLNINCREAISIIRVTAGPNGYVDPPGDIAPPGAGDADHSVSRSYDIEVPYGGNQTFTFEPDANYAVTEVRVNGAVVTPLPESGYTFQNVVANQTIQVAFGVQACSTDCQGCRPGDPNCPDCPPCERPEECVRLEENAAGSWQHIGSFAFIAGSGGYITAPDGLSADAVRLEHIDSNAGVDPVTVNNGGTGYSENTDGEGLFHPYLTVDGTYNVFVLLPDTFSGGSFCAASHVGKAPIIQASSGDHGSISPEGSTPVSPGGSQTFTMTPEDASRYYIADVLVDGSSVINSDQMSIDHSSNIGTYTFINVIEDHAITVFWDDNGDSCDEAKQIIRCGDSVTGSIDTGGDGDFFILNITAPQTVNIFTTGNIDTEGYLLNGTCTEALTHDNDSGADGNFSTERVLQPGDYYIKVQHFDHDSGTGAYTLNVACSSAPPDKTITIVTSEHGEITRTDGVPINGDTVTVPHGTDISFTMTPEDATYCIDEVNIKPTGGNDDQTQYLGGVAEYTFEYVEQDWTISANFSDCSGGGTPVEPPEEEEVSCVDISDIPLNVQIESAPPLVMFLLDDSGSMDMSINAATGGDGKFENYEYVFDNAHGDHTYYGDSGVLSEYRRRYWQVQWSEWNRMYYNPNNYYEPWPDLINDPVADPVSNLAAPGNADPDTPLSDPTKASTVFDVSDYDMAGDETKIECQTFDQSVESNGGRWHQVGSYNLEEGMVEVVLTHTSGEHTSADAVAIVPTSTWQSGVDIQDQEGAVVIDNESPGDEGFSTTGSWSESAGQHGWNSALNPPDFDPDDGRYSIYSSQIGATAKWSAAITEEGEYNIYVAWTYRPNRTANASYCVKHYPDTQDRVGMSATYVAIRELGGERITVSRAPIQVGNAEVDDNDSTGADAIALVPVSDWQNGVAIENQTGVIIIDNTDADFVTDGIWHASTAADQYGSNALYTDQEGASATWLINAPSGNYYVFINVSKKNKTLAPGAQAGDDGAEIWGYWDTTVDPPQWVSNNSAYQRARHAPYTVYSESGSVEFTTEIDQMKGKPNSPAVTTLNAADADEWNTVWQAYWHDQWNGGAAKSDADTTWIKDSSGRIISPPSYGASATWGWNGLDWIPLGTGNPGKVFTFTGEMADGQERAKSHKIPNSHYYTVDKNGEVWLVEMNKADPKAVQPADQVDHISYYKFTDGATANYGTTDYVDAGELELIEEASVPEEIKNYKDQTGATKPLTYEYARQNFANWYSYYRRRDLAAKAAVGLVIAESKNLMMGFHTLFEKTELMTHVRVQTDAGELDDRTKLLTSLYDVQAIGGSTPLRKGLKRIGEYFSGTGSGDLAKDPNDLYDPYWSPENGGNCQHAFVIAMTDGYYNSSSPDVGNEDNGAPTDTDYDEGAFGDNYSNTLADVAMKYYEKDLNGNMEDIVPNRPGDTAPHQHMVTYTVAFGVTGDIIPEDYLNCPPDCPTWAEPNTSKRKIDDLYHASINGRGGFISAQNPQELVDALKKLMAEMEATSGTGASVTTNTGQLKEGAMVFQGLFQSDGWTGDIIAYSLNSTTGKVEDQVWSASEKLTEKDADARVIFTLDTAENAFQPDQVFNGVPFRWDNLSSSLQNELTSADDTLPEDDKIKDAKLVLDFVRGDHGNEIGGDPGGTFRARPIVENTGKRSKLGDVVHSQTLNIHYDKRSDPYHDPCTDETCYDVLYAGANDGKLHAFDSATGEELWAYIPNLVFADKKFRMLTEVDYSHKYFVDGNQYAENVKKKESDPDKIILVGSLRKGGKGIYSLDITNPTGSGGPSGSMSEEYAASEIANWEYPVKYMKDADGNVIENINSGKLEITYEGLGTAITRLKVNDVINGKYAKAKIGVIDHKKQVLTLYDVEKTDEESSVYFEDTETIYEKPCDGACGSAKVRISTARTEALFHANSDADMGYSFSKPLIVDSYVDCEDQSNCESTYVVIFGNGYESLRGHAVLYVIVLDQNGKIAKDTDGEFRVYKIDTYPEEYDSLNIECNGLSTPTPVDIDLDEKVDYVYAGDLLGNLWKFDLKDPNPENWKVVFEDADGDPKPLFQAVNANGLRQPITTQPQVVIPCKYNQKGTFVSFGTGRYLGKADFDDETVQSVYGIWDWQEQWIYEALKECDADDFACIEAAKNSGSDKYFGKMAETKTAMPSGCSGDYPDQARPLVDNRLGDIDVRLVQQTSETITTTVTMTKEDADGNTYTEDVVMKYEVLSANVPTWYAPATGEGCHVGWYFDLPISRERVTSDPIVRDGVAYFVSTVPTDTPCVAGGTSVFWGMNVCSGGRITQPQFDINNDGVINSADLIQIGVDSDGNPILASPTGFHYNAYIYAPSFVGRDDGTSNIYIPEAGGGLPGPGGGDPPGDGPGYTAGSYIGIYYWKERD